MLASSAMWSLEHHQADKLYVTFMQADSYSMLYSFENRYEEK
jgi:hypothetical protein